MWRENNVDIVECVKCGIKCGKRIKTSASIKLQEEQVIGIFHPTSDMPQVFSQGTRLQNSLQSAPLFFPCSGDIMKVAKDPVVSPRLTAGTQEDGVCWLMSSGECAPLITRTVTAPDPGLETALEVAMKLG